MRPAALTAALAVATLSCATTTLRSGEPPGRTAAGLDERWHTGFLFGAIRGMDRYDLGRACPHGWAEIRVEPDPFTLLAGAVTLFIYSPSRVTVVCARRPGDEELAF
ncbi:MAG TPA: hypothetical protein VEX18_15120 [Polyangiaceae bacterium]|nr:hypothetical protein [Polyangiaceae bacterium]